MSRIRVTPADDDEVIVVGAGVETVPLQTSGADVPKGDRVAEGSGDSEDLDAREGQEGQGSTGSSEGPWGPEGSGGPENPEALEGPKAPEGRAKEGKSSPSSPTSKHEYRETTLEDLDSSDMPLTQRVVIIAAIVCIIGALVYYFVVMR